MCTIEPLSETLMRYTPLTERKIRLSWMVEQCTIQMHAISQHLSTDSSTNGICFVQHIPCRPAQKSCTSHLYVPVTDFRGPFLLSRRCPIARDEDDKPCINVPSTWPRFKPPPFLSQLAPKYITTSIHHPNTCSRLVFSTGFPNSALLSDPQLATLATLLYLAEPALPIH